MREKITIADIYRHIEWALDLARDHCVGFENKQQMQNASEAYVYATLKCFEEGKNDVEHGS